MTLINYNFHKYISTLKWLTYFWYKTVVDQIVIVDVLCSSHKIAKVHNPHPPCRGHTCR